MESPAAASSSHALRDGLTGPRAVAAVLVLFWFGLVASIWNKSVTVDEPATPVAGITHWKFSDYRLDPENGNLPHRLAALPLFGTGLPELNQRAWLNPEPSEFGEDWLHLPGNSTVDLLRRGRAVMSLVAVALAALVWHCSRRLFGPAGGMLSLLLCVLNPTILANGPLMTADTLVAFFFLAATWTWWRLLDRITPGRLALSILATGGLIVSKMSGGLIVPLALILAGVRLADPRPLEASGWGWRAELKTRWRRATAILGAGAVQGLAVWVILWGCYGFRYAMIAPGQPSTRGSALLWEPLLGLPSLPEAIEDLSLPPGALLKARAIVGKYSVPLDGWSELSALAREELRRDVLTPAQAAALEARLADSVPRGAARLILFLARHEVLPEAYLEGALFVVRNAGMRWAFLNGEIYHVGRPGFFPYTFAFKTPLPFLGLLVLAAAAGWAGRRRAPPEWNGDVFHHCLPFAILFLWYGVVAVASGLNIGHRHILALYPPLLVLAGAAGRWLPGWNGRPASVTGSPAARRTGAAVWLLLCTQGAEIAWRFPDYLAYFNGIVSPAEAYRHLVDSSLDWGQDLPGVKKYLDGHAAGGPFYLSYFGVGHPETYGIAANFLPSHPGRFRRDAAPVILAPIAGTPATDAEIAALGRKYPAHNAVGSAIIEQGKPVAMLMRRPADWRLTGGTYLISATLLQLKPWGRFEESNYQNLLQATRAFVTPANFDEFAGALARQNFNDVTKLLAVFEEVRMSRLAAYLRSYTPDDDIGHSILVYKLTDADIAQALEGPPPYRIPDRGRTLH